MKKGVKLYRVEICDGTVTAFDVSNEKIALTRAQRNIMKKFKGADFLDAIRKAFSNPDILHDDFTVVCNGEIHTYK